METNNNQLAVLNNARENYVVAMKDAKNLDIVNNVAGAFDAAILVNRLEAVLTDEVMKSVFMPLMGKKIGFRTDYDPTKRGGRLTPYSIAEVRTCIIDAAALGLLPTGNQFNIIAGNMYPTKEGFTALLAKLKSSEMQLVYLFEFDVESTVKSTDPQYMAIPCKVSYKTSSDEHKGTFRYIASVKVNRNKETGEVTSNVDQLRGKAERKCKKAFYEFLTGMDLGDGEAETEDTTYEDVTQMKEQTKETAPDVHQRAREAVNRLRERQASNQPNNDTIDQPKAEPVKPADAAYEPQVAPTAVPATPHPAQESPQRVINLAEKSDEEISKMMDGVIPGMDGAYQGQGGGAR